MIRLYKIVGGKVGELITDGETLTEAVEKAYEAGTLDGWGKLSREDYDEQIEALKDHVQTAKSDYLILGTEE